MCEVPGRGRSRTEPDREHPCGGITDVLPELAVLAAFAAVLLTLATWRLHRVTVRAA